MHDLIHRCRALTFGAALLLGTATNGWSIADEPTAYPQTAYPQTTYAEPASWQGPAEALPVETLPLGTVPADTSDPRPSPAMRTPADRGVAPLLDDCNNEHEIVIGEELMENYQQNGRGVRPYGGGHPDDWPWGCGGSPFRTGPGRCDTYRVGPIWDVAVDGMVMHRKDTDLPAIDDQFGYAPGGRVSMIGKYPWRLGYQVQAAYEGIEAWEAEGVIPNSGEFDSPLIRNYRSNLHSGELNILRCGCCTEPVWRPYCGVRYIQFDDVIRDVTTTTTTGSLVGSTDSIVGMKNNLMGFQVGGRYDVWRPNNRLALEGLVSGGLYYNKIKFTSIDYTETDDFQRFGDLSEIAYSYEASLSGVCRLNKCWAMRAGYQVLWIKGLHLADNAFPAAPEDVGFESEGLLFHGWHAGIECRR